jgi:hypothetical protein
MITQTSKPVLFISPTTPNSALQACIDQLEVKDGNLYVVRAFRTVGLAI